MLNTVGILSLILAGLMIWIGRSAGFRSFLSIGINFLILLLNIRLIAWGFPALVVTLLSALFILATTIFLGNSNDQSNETAFYATLLVLAVLTGLIVLLQGPLSVQGFGNENTEDLEGMSLLVGIQFQQIMTSTMLISTLGAISEAAIAEATGLTELVKMGSSLTTTEILKHGFSIGHEIIGTALNTLFFGFFGGFLGLFIWYVKLNYHFAEFINNKIFVSEIAMVLISFIGVALTVPLTVIVIRIRAKNLRE